MLLQTEVDELREKLAASEDAVARVLRFPLACTHTSSPFPLPSPLFPHFTSSLLLALAHAGCVSCDAVIMRVVVERGTTGRYASRV